MTKGKQAYHHGDLRTALLDAVGEIIRDSGVGAVSLREAARRAGVSHSAPAHHFGDKNGLLTAYATRGFEIFREQMQTALDSAPDPRAAFQAIGRAYVSFALERNEYFEIMFREELHHSEDPELDDAGRRAFAVLLEAVRQVAEAGLVGDKNPMHVAMSAWATVHGMATLWLTGAPSKFTDEDLGTLLEGVFEVSQTELVEAEGGAA
ncbi:MAG: TetR/AcrR family transcriptional regulator [Acidimicrobiia bacterium]|nr:TetR/AcrR family transcriptional regulator [Acidimicrobiia bacterium]